MENSTATTGQNRLGPILYTHGTKQNTKHLCEGGVRDNWTSISWDEIESIFVDDTQVTVHAIPTVEGITVRIRNTKGDEVFFTKEAFFKMRDEAKYNFLELYQLIVSKVMDRQWSQFVRDIEEGKKVSFGRFFVFSSAIYRKKFFGGHHAIAFDRIAGCNFADGDLVLDYFDDKRRLKHRRLSPVSEIPNVHLIEALVSSRAQKNSGR